MNALTFKRGIHPNYHKDATASLPIEVMLPEKELVFPMSQHIGAPCTPSVKKGDYVYVGQEIGTPNGFVSAAIHSSVSGTVKAVEPRMTLKGVKDTCVVVENDELYALQEEKSIVPKKMGEPLTKAELIEYVKAAGLVGLGPMLNYPHQKIKK